MNLEVDQFARDVERSAFDFMQAAMAWAVKYPDAAYILLRWGDGDGGALVEAIRSAAGVCEKKPGNRFVRRKISSARRLAVFRRDGFLCRECGSDADLTIDHIHPVSRGGDNSLENLRVLCRCCNSKKRARVLEKIA